MALSIAVLVVLLGQTPATKEMVVLPPEPKGVSQKTALKAWARAAKDLKKQSRKLKLSFKNHNVARNAIRASRKKTWECKGNQECLAAFGDSLEADLVVSGAVTKKHVTLVVIDVRTGKRLFGTKSASKYATRSLNRKVDAAVRGIVKELPAALNPAPTTDPEPRGEAAPPPSETDTAAGLAVAGGAAAGGAAAGAAAGSPAPSPPPSATEPAPTATAQAEPAPKAPTPTPPPSQINPEPAPIVASVTPAEDRGSSKTWLIWTSIVAVAAAGAATAVALVVSGSGGPSVDGETGSITGSY